ncbi:hypothetical protein ST4_103 [Aeromonas phage ST4]|nr:hypothetical protein ST4_103 [Aeromonas phage ST4]
MSNQVSITDLLTAVGSDNINFQVLATSLQSIKGGKKNGVAVTFLTDALTVSDVAKNSGPCGLILWLDGKRMDSCLQDLKAGKGLTYDKPLEQHNELLAALEEARTGLAWYQETYPEAANGSDDEAMERIDAAIANAKGGAA